MLSVAGAIMFNDPLDLKQCQRLIGRLSKTIFPFQCAHGRWANSESPLTLSLNFYIGLLLFLSPASQLLRTMTRTETPNPSTGVSLLPKTRARANVDSLLPSVANSTELLRFCNWDLSSITLGRAVYSPLVTMYLTVYNYNERMRPSHFASGVPP